MNESHQHLWITTPTELVALCERLQGSEWIALDTEFMRERTYFPQLCLVQLATPDVLACVDPLAVPDLNPLLDVFADTAITKVFHAARQDLEIFFNLTQQVPTPIFDTQLAASFAGYPDQVGYGTLVESLLGVRLEKGHTRTDWSRRPLPEGAVHYAVDDVRYLREVYLKLREELARRGRLDWLERERSTLENPDTYRNDPAQAWKRLRGARKLKPRQLGLARVLAEWREQRAISEDLPRQWILKDELLTDIARRQPATLEAIGQLRGMTTGSLQKYGDALLDLIREAHPSLSAPAVPDKLDAGQEALIDLLTGIVRLKCDEAGVSAAQLATRSDLERLVRGERELDVLRGWRMEMVGQTLLSVLAGELRVTIHQGRLKLSPSPSKA